MSKKNITSQILHYTLALVLVVGALVATTALANWSNPSATGVNRATLLNRGPVTQVKQGRINVTSGASQLSNAFFEVEGPAFLRGGLYVEGDQSLASVVLGDMFVGYENFPNPTPTAQSSEYTLAGNVAVTRNIGADNLAHTDAGDRQPVCTTLEGWLVPCVAIDIPELPLGPSLPTNVNWYYYDGNTKSYGYMDRLDSNGNEIFSIEYDRLGSGDSTWVTVLSNDEVNTSPSAPGGVTRLMDVTANGIQEIQFGDSNVSSAHPFSISRVRVSLDGVSFGPWYYLFQNNVGPTLTQIEAIENTPSVSLSTVWVECTDQSMHQSIGAGGVAMTCFEHNILGGALGTQSVHYSGTNTMGTVTVVEYEEFLSHQNPTSTNLQPPADHPNAVLGVAISNTIVNDGAVLPLRTVVPLQDY